MVQEYFRVSNGPICESVGVLDCHDSRSGIAHFAEGYPLAAFGFQRSQKTLRARLIEWILTVLVAAVIASVIILFSGYVRGHITDEPAPALQITRMLPVWVLIPAWITGSLTEEVLFRSYPIERLT